MIPLIFQLWETEEGIAPPGGAILKCRKQTAAVTSKSKTAHGPWSSRKLSNTLSRASTSCDLNTSVQKATLEMERQGKRPVPPAAVGGGVVQSRPRTGC